jgi:concanavalin A-like lectin/glucanase superfamily protein/FecR-like protein
MHDIDSLIHRYLEDRDSLSARELDTLVSELRADAELAARLRDQLVMDDLLAQKLALDRRNFVAQVEQRVADLKRGQVDIGRQTADLRSMSAAEKTSARSSLRALPNVRWMLALSLLVAVGVAAFGVRFLWPHAPAVATVTDVIGSVTIGENGDASTAEKDDSLENGQRIVVPQNGSIGLAYQDGTHLLMKNDAVATIGSELPESVKQIRVERGEVVAQVKPQSAGSMIFVTPHGKAKAQAGEFRLVVSEENTVVEVRQGSVHLDRNGDRRTLLIAANESGMASRDTYGIRKLAWPDRRDGLAYLVSPLEPQKENKPLTVARSPETHRLRGTLLEPRGQATLLDSRYCYELNGGYLFAGDAGPDIAKASRGGSELTLEAVFSPASMEQTGPARIVALAPESDGPDFSLDQDGSDLMFCIKTDDKPMKDPPRVSINATDSPVHFTVTYRNGELIAYRDGMEINRSTEVWGSLAGWQPGPLTVGADASGERAWRGIMEALALYNRCLEPNEVARNARNYRLLAGRGM